ncbi:YceI family protein [Robiginitalea sp. IMCC44478]|uniref:YceI family protein n=1 Tax=Robiginitalea sp. IMCC44478 TaxID=3459122 RepID=UPI004041FBCE
MFSKANYQNKIARNFLTGLLLFALPMMIVAQEFKPLTQKGEVTVTGTSTLHDWEIIAEQTSGILIVNTEEEIPVIDKLEFQVLAESLKSGKGGMDNNTYNALNTEKYPNISFKMLEVMDIQPIISTSNRFKVKASANLTIAGTTRKTDISFILSLGHELKIEGIKPLKMTTYKIEPPKALLGTIKTGDAVEVHFNTVWTK